MTPSDVESRCWAGAARRPRQPPAPAAIESQTVKTTEAVREHGYDGAKRITGREASYLRGYHGVCF